jgi:beta-N-acetylhexosaminidase
MKHSLQAAYSKVFLLILMSTMFIHNVQAQPANKSVALPAKQATISKWADSVYNALNLDERIGQLFMVAAYSGGPKMDDELITKLVSKHHIGGLIFMQGTAEKQAELTNKYQKKCKVPLFIAMDAEWGLGMRLSGVQDMPRQIMMGAMQDPTLVYKLGKAVAEQCKRLGVHINFAPVVDVNNNPDNPVINFRSFGEDKYKVADLGVQYCNGLQNNMVMACAKHFPGHGNTNVDSHTGLPLIGSSKKELNDLELYPFKSLINNGIGSIMIAHLQIPSLDNRDKTPTTLSDKVVTQLLKNELGYQGLIFTDALNMEAVAKMYPAGEVDLRAFLAGNDVLLFSQDVPLAIAKIKTALNNGTISEERLAESVKKILDAKAKFNLDKFSPIVAEGATADLNKAVSGIRSEMASNSITLLNDKYGFYKRLANSNYKRKVLITLGNDTANTFSDALGKFGFKQHTDLGSAISVARDADFALISLHSLPLYPKDNFKLSASQLSVLNNLLKLNNTSLVIFGNPYVVKNFCAANSLVVAYDDKPETHLAMAKIVNGSARFRGKLPVSVCDNFAAGTGITINADGEFENKNENDFDPKTAGVGAVTNTKSASLTCCVNPSTVNADAAKLSKIDDYINSCIAKKVFPGCKVLLAKDGKIFYEKSFGYFDYNKTNKVDENTIYDIASVTKVASTTLAVMRLYEKGKLNLNGTLGEYLPMTRGTNKANCTIKDLLMHQAGLETWIAFYKETLDSNKQRKDGVYSTKYTKEYSMKVAENLFMNKNWVDTMWNRILTSKVGSRKYDYSDLDFIFLQKVVERITGTTLDAYVDKEFYKPLGLKRTAYNPLKKGLKVNQIAPSELDNYWRYDVVQGYVHDMGAAMFGGVSGHAGLFSTTYELAIIMQMLLNNGVYNGKRYFTEETIKKFTSYGGSTRRGLGWDKPDKNRVSSGAVDNCSLSTFGHQGFTGTCLWADPEHGLQFIFLSNRTYPKMDNNLINDMGVRKQIQRYAYEALGIK